MSYEIIQSDVLEALKKMPDSSVDAVLCDPPYALGTKDPTGAEIIAYLQGARLDTGGDFMSKKWDLPSVEVWREVLRVLRPGAHVLAFGGTRMFDVLTIGMRAAGFECRDVLSWQYGSGFPKSLSLGKAIDKSAGAEREVVGEKMTPDGKLASARRPNSEGRYDNKSHTSMSGATRHDSRLTAPATPDAARFDGYGTALKPSWEPVVLARRPLDGTVAHNALAHGTGGINIDGTRIGYASEADKEAMSAGVEAIRERGGVMNNSWKNSSDLSGANPASTLGRWPANVVLSHSPGCRKVGETETQAPVINRFTDGMKPFGGGAGHPYESSGGGTETIPVYECEPDCPVRLLDEQSGKLPAGVAYEPTDGRPKSHSVYGDIGTLERTIGYGDSGGASRFFATFPADGSEETRFRYVAKASKAEREFGCEQLPARTGAESVEREEGSAGTKSPRAGSGRTSGDPIMQLRSDLTEEDRRLVLDQLQAAGVKI